jgi:hypothetical protein
LIDLAFRMRARIGDLSKIERIILHTSRHTHYVTGTDADEPASDGRAEAVMQDGTTLVDELAVTNAHPLGAGPFGRDDCILKFRTLAEGVVSEREANRFLAAVEELSALKPGELNRLNVAVRTGTLRVGRSGIFRPRLEHARALANFAGYTTRILDSRNAWTDARRRHAVVRRGGATRVDRPGDATGRIFCLECASSPFAFY